MANALVLFGLLLLTVLGLSLPLLSILFSFFPKGLEILTTKYESERNQSEENIIEEEAKKGDSGRGLDIQALEKTLKTLKENRKRAETKLSFLNPTRLIIKIAVPLAISFVATLVALQSVPNQSAPTPAFLLAALISVSALFYAVRVLWISFQVLSEVAKVVNESREGYESKIIELLSALVERGGAESLFIKPERINIEFNNILLKQDEKLTFSANKKYDVPISITNSDELMAKTVEVGFTFPPDFLVEKTPNISSIYPWKGMQIVRFKLELLHAHTTHERGKIGITFLKTGEFKSRVFIKGENVKNKEVNFLIKVID